MISTRSIVNFWRAARRRLAAEHGFTMVVALGVLMVTSLLIGAVYVAVDGGLQLSQRDLNGQRAYYNARAGENAFLYQLNQNPNFWSTCSNDYQPTATAVPGTSTGGKYSFVPVYNSGYSNSNCTTTNAISALIDPNTGTLRMEFTGYAGPPNAAGTPSVKRTLVASFRKPSPLDFLWYTDHEMEDPQLNSACKNEKYYYQYSSVSQAPCPIYWVSGDTMSGPSYTNDQYLINSGASPTFGRAGSDDQTESSAPTASVCVSSSCQHATFNGQGAVAGAEPVPLPASVSSTQLLADANGPNGQVFTGTTTINLTSGGSATISNCGGTTSSASCSLVNKSETLPSIIYVQSGSSCPSTYSASTYAKNSQSQYYGACGDVYVHGYFTTPLTIVSDHDIIIMANTSGLTNPGITTTVDGSGNPTGNATLGLVAGDFVRVMHASGVSPTAVTIDAAILTLAHSFIVDNWGSDTSNPTPKLSVHGAIAQRYRGAVGTTAGAGYVKDYHYDDRLKVLLPPYLFSLSTAGWEVSRETLCTPNAGTTNSASCAYQGT
ncbi:MAG TPA: hypothetical protein VMJ65_23445 [Solirubrobacteraceae bacterium]|nr:hypothetical protein [Solirubrobacteraceae bacterium]